MMSKCPFTNARLQAGMTAPHALPPGVAVAESATTSTSSSEEQCPVINNINDEEAREEGVRYEGASPLDFDEEFEDEIPSMRQYKKLKRITSLITDFYRNGTKMKSHNFGTASEDLARLDVDKKMAEEQLAALMTNASFKGHLKYKDVKEELENDINRLEVERKTIAEHHEKTGELAEWSKGIVKICEWLEVNLDNYCKEYLDLPASIAKNIQPIPELTKEKQEEYSKGIDEIMHNLNESRDFFQAAVDGRLDKYYEIEKGIVENQLEVLAKFPESSARRQYIEQSLKEDLAHAEAQLASGLETKTQQRRQKMLDLHLDFLKVLNFFKNKLRLLNEGGDRMDRQYDASFTTTFAIGAEALASPSQ